ncbi:MAG: hypothetical protein ACK4UZ_03990 [Rhizobium rhizophilum]
MVRTGLIVGAAVVSLAVIQALAMSTASDKPPLTEHQARRSQLCDQARDWVLNGADLLTLERGKFIARELRCKLVD